MTAQAISVGTSALYYGTAAEIVALSANTGDVGFATDTQTEYTNYSTGGSGTDWVITRVSTNGTAHVRTVASDVAFPSQQYLGWTGTAGAADNAVIYTSVDVSAYNWHTFTVSGTSPADVYVSHDGITYDVIAVTLTDDVTTGGGVKVITIPTGKSAFLHGKWKYIRVIEDGPTDSNCLGAHGVV